MLHRQQVEQYKKRAVHTRRLAFSLLMLLFSGGLFLITKDKRPETPPAPLKKRLAQGKAEATGVSYHWDRGGQPMVLRAKKGVWSEEQGVLLSGQVSLQDKKGTRIQTDKATFLPDKNIVKGDGPVQGSGPFGTFDSQSFVLKKQGGRVILKGKSSIVLESVR